MVEAVEMEDSGHIQSWSPAQPSFVKMLVYGHSGVGKTPFAASAPAPLFLDADKGMASVTKSVDRWECNSWADVQEALSWLRLHPGHPYKTLVLDSITEIQRQILDSVIRTYKGSGINRQYDDQPARSDWGKALADFEKLIRLLSRLPMNVIVTAHGTRPELETSRVEPAFQGRNTSSMVCRYHDVIAYLAILPGSEGGAPRQVMFTRYAQGITRDRSGKLPSVIEQPSWEKLEQYWQPKK